MMEYLNDIGVRYLKRLRKSTNDKGTVYRDTTAMGSVSIMSKLEKQKTRLRCQLLIMEMSAIK